VVFKVDTSAHETVLYGFPANTTDGRGIFGGVIRDSPGNLYGATYAGGPSNSGIVFNLDATGHETVLYSFTGGADGYSSVNSLTRDAAGNLYGTTLGGGIASGFSGFGVVFKVDTSGKETVLYTFTGRCGWRSAMGRRDSGCGWQPLWNHV
jgi:uncharacterized repeat protein (TIGR03803 family)